jgi:hypothetical protein
MLNWCLFPVGCPCHGVSWLFSGYFQNGYENSFHTQWGFFISWQYWNSALPFPKDCGLKESVTYTHTHTHTHWPWYPNVFSFGCGVCFGKASLWTPSCVGNLTYSAYSHTQPDRWTDGVMDNQIEITIESFYLLEVHLPYFTLLFIGTVHCVPPVSFCVFLLTV